MAEREEQHGGMASRGVTRPMAEKEMRQRQEDRHEDQPVSERQVHRYRRSGQGEGPMHEDQGEQGHGMMSPEQREHMLHMHYRQTLWIYWLVVLLGLWTLVAPFTFGYLNEGQWVAPSGGRGPWFGSELHTELRAWLMTWSDVLSGLLLIVFGWRALRPNRPVSLWICCFVGIWLNLAPLVFWAPTAAAYLNDTLVGALVIGLTVLIPGMPNMIVYMKMGPTTPAGWSYNPSSWPQRSIMIATGFAGWLVSRYLGAFQLGYIDAVWDPFFGEGSRLVLNSNMSHMWPISDAAFGTFAYTFEFLMGWMGSPARWRTMPWMVTFFGILVIPLGLVHIFLVISQPVVVGHWCFFCLVAAAIMLPMIPLEVDEVIAMGQFLKRARRRGESLWKAFWLGGGDEGGGPDERSPELMTLPERPARVLKASIWGMSFPWTLWASTALGIWLIAASYLFGLDKPAADVARLSGALTVTFAVVAMGEPLRLLRYLNVLLGLGAAVLPWFIGGGNLAGNLISAATGLLIAALSLPRGPKTESYGTWDRLVR